jgi:hypothetical protein
MIVAVIVILGVGVSSVADDCESEAEDHDRRGDQEDDQA